MKKLLLSSVMIIVLCTGALEAQVKQNLVKTSLTSVFFRTYVLAYERVFNADMSVQLGAYYMGWSVGDAQLDGFAVTPEFRYYLSEKKDAPSGGFIAPFVRYQSYSLTSKDLDQGDPEYAKGTLSAIGGGILVGYQRLFKETISLSAFIGPAYNSGDVEYESNEGAFDVDLFDGFGVRAGVNLGFAF